MKQYVMGIDGGTGGMRVGIYDLQGNPACFASTPYPTAHLHPGWADQAPADWWRALVQSVGEAMQKSGISPRQIAALGVDTTNCSVLLCQRDGTPVRDCLIWMDVRSAPQAERIRALTGENLSPEWMPSKLLWLKENEPEHYEGAQVFCEYQDWMTYRLTGLWSINVNCSCNWGYDARLGDFHRDFYRAIGLADALDKFPDERVFRVGQPIGGLTEEAAAQLGLCPGTLVCQGGIDASIGILGMGACRPGQVALITGSSNLAMVLTPDPPPFGEATVNAGPDNLIEGYYTAYRGQVSSGSILKWFIGEFCKDLSARCQESGESVYALLDREAEGLPIGSGGLIALDYWQGNQHPYLDGNVRGLVYGFSLHHTRAHLYRALLEGIAYGTENLLCQLRENGFAVERLHISGGTAQSDLFLQIHADISNVEILVPRDKQASCLGSAICAAVGLGAYPDLPTASEAMVAMEKQILPDPARHARYQAFFEQYRKLYPQLKDWMHDTTALAADGQ